MGLPPRAVALVDDLLFITKIQDACRRRGWEVVFATSRDSFLQQAQQGARLFLLDLHHRTVPPLEAAAQVKRDPVLGHWPMVGYYSHVHTELRQEALAAGLDLVLPRSAFSAQLPGILDRFAAGLRPTPGEEEPQP